MRLKHVYISSYKNLKDFSIDFDEESFIDVFVGKNGTGKSNLLEALIDIFRHLYEDDHELFFNYNIEYSIEGTDVKIEWEDGKWIKEKKETKKVSKNLLPDNILIYYSGHNRKVKQLIEDYEERFKKKIKGAKNTDSRRFIAVDENYKTLLLTVLLLQPDENKAKQFILEKLGIKSVSHEFQISLQRPFYARQKGYDVDILMDDTKFWKAAGITKDFLDKLETVDKGKPAEERDADRPKGYFSNSKFDDEYILYYDIADFQNKFADTSSQELFKSFDNLKTIEMLKGISVEVELLDGTKIDIEHFSDGQFQSIYIYSITELFKESNCITLLDEPDSFLHPEWQMDFLKKVFEITSDISSSNHVLMTSHSAVTLIPFDKDKVRFFDFKDDNSIRTYSLPKRVAIDRLSSNVIQYCEQEQILSIINTIQIANKPVLFTEGKTDPLIIKEAWCKLFPEEEIPFIPFYAFGHRYLVQLIQDPQVIDDMNGLPIFGLFDYDKAFNTWNGFSDEDICTDIHSGLIKKLQGQDVYAMMLPVPKDKPIESQVINTATGQTFGENSLMAIEHLFCHLPHLDEMFVINPNLPSKFKKFEGNKVNFAKEIVPTITSKDFEVFRPMFDFIKSKIPEPVAAN